jgi:thiol-disulfide isomerase/thioredoxin
LLHVRRVKEVEKKSGGRLNRPLKKGTTQVKALVAVVLAGASAMAQSPVPRPAGALWIGGKDVLALAAGRPSVVAFVSTQCAHCAAVARVMQAASKEFPTVFFEAVAFDEGADAVAWSQRLGLNFPVFATGRQAAMRFLGLTEGRLGTPQMVYIDRAGVIRAQSEQLGTPMLQSPDFMRSIVAALLKGSHDR